jgi:hypothetical protein
MKRVRRAPLPWPLIALASTVVLSLLVGIGALGPRRAAYIALAASSNILVDGLNERHPAHRIRLVELVVAPEDLEALNADLPWSGGEVKAATLIYKGIRYPARFRYRGVYATTHFLGGKRSFRLSLKKDNPFSPYRKLNFINPKAFNMVNDHLALWIAGRMGVPVPYDDFAFVRINGVDVGVMEVLEQIDKDFERNRHISELSVAVFKGDHPPVTGRELPKPLALWTDAAHWEYVGGGDSALAHQRLNALVEVVRSKKLSTGQKRDSLLTLIDIDAYLRYCAALKVINTSHIDDHHNQWLVLSPRTGLFYPVLRHAPMMHPHRDEPLHPVHDALSRLVLMDPEWRLRCDRYVAEGIALLRKDGLWERHVNEVADRLEPSVLRDRNKYGQVSPDPADVHRYSFAHWTHSLTSLQRNALAYWEKVAAELKDVQADAVIHGNTVQVTAQGPNAFTVELQVDSAGELPQVVGAHHTVGWSADASNGGKVPQVTIVPRLLAPDSLNTGLHAPAQPYIVTITLPNGNIRKAAIHPVP